MTHRARFAILSLGLAFSSLAFARDDDKDKNNGGGPDREPYAVVLTENDSSAQALFERYPELSGSWDELATFNLLETGRVLEIPKAMLSSDGVLAKVATSYGDVEVKRSFENRFIPVVPYLLLREGDEIRTWRRSGVRVLFEDGNYVFVGSDSKVKVVALEGPNRSASSRLEILLKEGSIWSQIEKKLGGRFEIRTATANTIIRGTDFRVKVEPGDATRLEVLTGHVEFEVGDGRIAVESQQGALARGGGEPVHATPLPPPPDELLSPQPEEVIRRDGLNELFEWAPVPGARAYRLVVARDRQFFDRVIERRVAGEVSVRVQNLEAGTYFWRVSSEWANGFEGSPTESRYFVYVEAQP